MVRPPNSSIEAIRQLRIGATWVPRRSVRRRIDRGALGWGVDRDPADLVKDRTASDNAASRVKR
jgi:hypothetical protein